MPTKREFNNYSESIERILSENRPKHGEIVRFRVLSGLGQVMLPRTCFINVKREGETLSKRIEIGVIESYNAEGEPPNFKSIIFSYNEGHEILIHGENPHDLEIFDYLFLCSWNGDNKGKPWHIKPSSSNYKFKMFDNKIEARLKVDKNKKVRYAQNAIDDLTEDERFEMAKALFSNYKSLSPEEIIDKLYSQAEKDPAKIIGENTKVQLTMQGFVRSLQEADIIEFTRNKWIYKDTGDKIIGKPVKSKDSEIELLSNFLLKEENSELLVNLQDLLRE